MAKRVHASSHTNEDLDAILGELADQSDRGAAIVGAAFVEDYLAWAIESRLPATSNTVRARLFEGAAGALSTFSAKIEMGYAMGVFGPLTRRDLLRIKNIRNAFAHTAAAVDFSHTEVVACCAQLTWSKDVKLSEISEIDRRSRYGEKSSDARVQFILVCQLIMALLVSELALNPVKLPRAVALHR